MLLPVVSATAEINRRSLEAATLMALHEVTPVFVEHAPSPHPVGTGEYSWPSTPSQSSSIPSQVGSSPDAPKSGPQESWTLPALHEVTPVFVEHAPSPQPVGTGA